MSCVIQTDTCMVCKRVMETPLRCGRCRMACYCGSEHQREDWPRHRPYCSGQPPNREERDSLTDLVGLLEPTNILPALCSIKEHILDVGVQTSHNVFQLTYIPKGKSSATILYMLKMDESGPILLICPHTERSLPPLERGKISLVPVKSREGPLQVVCLNHTPRTPEIAARVTLRLFGSKTKLNQFLESVPGNRVILVAVPGANRVVCAKMGKGKIELC